MDTEVKTFVEYGGADSVGGIGDSSSDFSSGNSSTCIR